MLYAGAEALVREVGQAQETGTVSQATKLPADARFGGLKVLLVDDDLRNVFALRSVLEARQIEVFHAENGRLAIDVLKEHPDMNVVLMDTMMPEMDGLSATRAIRDISRYRAIPIISLTAKAMKGDREAAIEAGATDYITKPVEPERLLAIIHHWVSDAVPAAVAAPGP